MSSLASASALFDPTRLRRVIPIALTGAAIEWYDFFIYATAAALVFPALFFPPDIPGYVAAIASFSTLAVGMIARPAGAALFGHMGDKYGRKRALVTAMLVMGMASTVIGLLPTYAAIGLLAPLALTILRFLQGLAVGGQWGGAMLLITENAPANRKGYYGGYAQIGVPIGVVVANAAFLVVAATLSDEAFLAWGWRVPFLVSVVLIGIGLVAQLRLEESPAFKKAVTQVGAGQPKTKSPALAVLRSNPKQIGLAGGAFAAYIAYFYVLVSFVVQYATINVGVSKNLVLTAVMVGAAAQVISVMLAAAASDRFGRRNVFTFGVMLLAVWALPCFLLIDTGTGWGIFMALIVGQVFMGVSYGPQAALFSELFSTAVRYSGASLGYQFGAIIGGAFAPIIATALFEVTGTSLSISAYLIGISALSLLCILLIKETRDVDLHAFSSIATNEERFSSVPAAPATGASHGD